MATTDRATLWSLTINNPTSDDLEAIALARQKGWQVLGQAERGENGTIHYQLALKTPQVRFSQVKKQFPRAHIEPARSVPALLRYVAKEETRVASLPTQQDKYPSLSKYWDLVFEYLNDLDKNGLDYVELAEGHVRFYNAEREKQYRKNPLSMLDEATRSMIERGYHVESIGANPTTRSQWNLFHDQILLRSYTSKQNAAIEAQHADTQETQCDASTQTWNEEDLSPSSPSRTPGEDLNHACEG